jgi:hypothetical protein
MATLLRLLVGDFVDTAKEALRERAKRRELERQRELERIFEAHIRKLMEALPRLEKRFADADKQFDSTKPLRIEYSGDAPPRRVPPDEEK